MLFNVYVYFLRCNRSNAEQNWAERLALARGEDTMGAKQGPICAPFNRV